MANTRVALLFVLTLLQLCRAEISDSDNNNNLPEWFSANVINDGLQPKPISEIFSTESPFSTKNPIIVLPKLTMSDKILSSTFPPPSSISGDFTKTSVLPFSTTTPLPNTISTITPQLPTDFSSKFPSQTPQVEITQFTEQTQPPSQSLYETTKLLQQTPPISPYTNLEQQTTLLQDPLSSTLGRFVIPIKNEPEFPTTQQLTSPLPNYYVVYQQAPQNIQDSPQGGLFGTQQRPSSAQPGSSTVVIQPPTTTSPLTSRITSRNPDSTSAPSTSPSTSVPTTGRITTGRPAILGASTAGPIVTQLIRNCTNGTIQTGLGPLPLRIRVVGPRGSITNVNINPPVVLVPTTTRRPTTKRPTTPRTRKTPKPKRNTYEACLSGCKGRRGPICAIPLSATWIDPEKLKGFPSVCHMACFNSYRKESYEMLLAGRCGRLRTRIQAFDSNTKLTRQELNKAQYIVDNGDQTFVEVSALPQK